MITGGGIGPTQDDLTREAVAEVTGRTVVVHEPSLQELRERFQKRGFILTKNNERQAMIPDGAIVVKNPNGTAPAFMVEDPRGVVISPGPGEPRSAGVSLAMVDACAERSLPLLGVCLGHQSIGMAFGGRIVRARSIMHGKLSQIRHDGKGVFAGIASPLTATRYHSLVIEQESCPEELEVTARTDDGEIMGVRHIEKPIEGVQFHPESIMTEAGKALLANFLERCASPAAGGP